MTIAQEEFSILSSWKQWTDASNMLYHNIITQAFGLLRERTAKVSTLVTEGQWLKRQQEVRQKYSWYSGRGYSKDNQVS
jgi:hypothetical protein